MYGSRPKLAACPASGELDGPGRPRGRPRGRPKGSGGGRGRGRGRAPQTDGPRSPPLQKCSSHPSGIHNSSGSAYSFSHSPHAGAPGSYPYSPALPPGLQVPLPVPPSLGANGMTRHSKSSSRCPDEQSPSRGNLGTHSGWQGLPHSVSSREATSRLTSSSRSSELPCQHGVNDHRHGVDQEPRPTARKTHRSPREFPFQQEFEPTYSGKLDKRLSFSVSTSSTVRHDKDSSYRGVNSSEKASVTKYQDKEISHRIQFQNMEPTYQKQKTREISAYNESRSERDIAANHKSDREQFYEISSRQERGDQRFAGSYSLGRERELCLNNTGNTRRDRDLSYVPVPRLEQNRRSPSADSVQSYGSECTESPQFSPAPAGYPYTQQYEREPRHNSLEKDTDVGKHREESSERYPLPAHSQIACPQVVSAPRAHSGECCQDLSQRQSQRESAFSSSLCVDYPFQSKAECLEKSPKSSRLLGSSYAPYPSSGGNGYCASEQFARVSSYPDLQHPVLEQDLRRLPTESSWKKTQDNIPEQYSRNIVPDRGREGTSDRERPSLVNKKKNSSRSQSADTKLPPLVHFSQQNEYIPNSPYHEHSLSSAGDMREQPTKSLRSPTEDNYPPFRVPYQQSFAPQPIEQRSARRRRPSTPSPPESPYPSCLPTPPPQSPRPLSPPQYPNRSSPNRHLSEETSNLRRSSLSPSNADSPECSIQSFDKQTKSLSNPSTPRIQRRNSDSLECPKSADPSPSKLSHAPTTEPMAWQLQYLKHLQKQMQEQQDEYESEAEEEDPKTQDLTNKTQEQKKNDPKMQQEEQLRREFLKIQEEKIKKEEELQKEFMRLQLDKLQKEHMRQLKQLDQDHMMQRENMRREHQRQQQEQLQRGHFITQEQRNYFQKQLELLQHEQLRQQTSLRREQMQQVEQMHRDHQKLQQDCLKRQQDYLQKEEMKLQETMRREKQDREKSQKVPSNDSMAVRQLPAYVQQRYDKIQQQQQQQPPCISQQEHTSSITQNLPPQMHNQQQYSRHVSGSDQLQPVPYQLPNVNLLSVQPASQLQQSYMAYMQHSQTNSQLPSQQQQQQHHQQQQQQQQQQHHQQQQQQHHQQQQQQQYQQQQQQQQQHQLYQQHGLIPVPPWRQVSSGKDNVSFAPRQADSSPVRNGQITLPATQAAVPTSPTKLQPSQPVRQVPVVQNQSAVPYNISDQSLKSADISNAAKMSVYPSSPYMQQYPPHCGVPSMKSVDLNMTKTHTSSYTSSLYPQQYHGQSNYGNHHVNHSYDVNQSMPARYPVECTSKRPPWLQDHATVSSSYVAPWLQQSGQTPQLSSVSTSGAPYSSQQSGNPLSALSSMNAMSYSSHCNPQQQKHASSSVVMAQNEAVVSQRQQSIYHQHNHNVNKHSYSGLGNVQPVPHSSSQTSLVSHHVNINSNTYPHGADAHHQIPLSVPMCTPQTEISKHVEEMPLGSAYQYQSSSCLSKIMVHQEMPLSDHECAQKVLEEALNEQQLHEPDLSSVNALPGEQQNVFIFEKRNTEDQISMHDALINSAGIQQLSVNRHSVNEQTYTLHHPFDDSAVYQQQESVQMQQQTHEVVPGNPLDTAVAMLNLDQEGTLDIPLIEQHQEFVLEPPRSGSPTRQQQHHSRFGCNSATVMRRSSWHTPENSTIGSGPGSCADDTDLVIDINTEMCDDDDNIFGSETEATQNVHDTKAILQSSVSICNSGINEIGLKISSVFSLATKKRRRRAMSDSMLQEVEIVNKRESTVYAGIGISPLVTHNSSSYNDLSQEYSNQQNNECAESSLSLDIAEEKKDSLDCFANFDHTSQDPLAELTKLLFADGHEESSAPSSHAEEWNVHEAAGFSLEADSVCVPGTPAMCEPEALATHYKQLYTPMPHMVGTPRPHYIREPHVPLSHLVKNPPRSLPSCAKEFKDPFTPLPPTPFSSYCTKDFKDLMSPAPCLLKEAKESNVMGPPATLPNLNKKARDPCIPPSPCNKESATPLCSNVNELSVTHPTTSETKPEMASSESVLEIRVDAMEKAIHENAQRASKQPLEQAIRELLGDDPIGQVTNESFMDIDDNSPHRVPKRHRLREAECRSDRRSSKCSLTEPEINTFSSDTDHDKNIKSRVKETWEKRCCRNVNNTSKPLMNRAASSRDRSREPDREKYFQTRNEGSQRSRLPLSQSRSALRTKEEEDEDKKSCGVRGRRMMMIAGKKRHISERVSSSEEISPDRSYQTSNSSNNSNNSSINRESVRNWHHTQRTVSQSSSEEAPDDKVLFSNELVKQEIEDDVFFPCLSRSNSTDSSLASDAASESKIRRRLLSSESNSSRLSSCSSIGEDINDTPTGVSKPHECQSSMDSPQIETKFDGSPHVQSSSHELVGRFHEHKLYCFEQNKRHYVVLEELLSKCLNEIPKARVRRAVTKELNTNIHNLCVPAMKNRTQSVVTLMEASRLLDFFHGKMRCPGINCRLRTSAAYGKDRKDAANSRPKHTDIHAMSKSSFPESEYSKDEHTGNNERTNCLAQNNSCSGGEDNRQNGKSADRNGNQESSHNGGDCNNSEGPGDVDGHEDTRSCNSDQTFPYCDGQAMTSWEEEQLMKNNDNVSVVNSDGEQAHSPIVSHTFVSTNRKFRRHSSDSEGKMRKIRDKDAAVSRGKVHNSPDNFSEERSPKLPPLPSYIASPFTPGSLYNVPMDNERILLECFSAPGSQAPSSVRSAPSIRLASPDRADLQHYEEDLFEGLSVGHKVISDHSISRRPQQKAAEGEKTTEHVLEKLHSQSKSPLVNSKATPDLHRAECDLDDTDDIFTDQLIGEAQKCELSNTANDLKLGPSFDSQDNFSSKHDINEDFLNKLTERKRCEESFLSAEKKSVSLKVEGPQYIATVHTKAATEKSHLHKDQFDPLSTRKKELQMGIDLREKLCVVAASIAKKDRHAFNIKNMCRGERFLSNVEKDLDFGKCAESKKDINIAVDKRKHDIKAPTGDIEISCTVVERVHAGEDPSLVIERKDSDQTLAYGSSDDENSVGEEEEASKADRSTQAAQGSHISTGPPELSTAGGSIQTVNSPHTSPPRIEPVDSGTRVQNLIRKADLEPEVKCNDGDDERVPPDCTNGTLEDRVHSFISHGSQYMTLSRSIMRSNSLPELCVAETAVVRPARKFSESENTEDKPETEISSHTPGPISSRSHSYPGSYSRLSECHDNMKDLSGSCTHALSPTSSRSEIPEVKENHSPLVQSVIPDAKEIEWHESSKVNQVHEEVATNSVTKEVGFENSDRVDFNEVVDGGEISTKATPRRSPGVSADVADVNSEQLVEWAVPCAAHGSVFCSCEGIDVQSTGQDVVPASPRVGSWLCTPSTPAPPTPYCDYKLVYSPFPVVGGMTPARPEMTSSRPYMTPARIDTADTPVPSPKVFGLPESDVGCGVKRQPTAQGQPAAKRQSTTQGQPAAKRRLLTPAKKAAAVEENNVLNPNDDLELVVAKESKKDIAMFSKTEKVESHTQEAEVSESDKISETQLGNSSEAKKVSSADKADASIFPARQDLSEVTDSIPLFSGISDDKNSCEGHESSDAEPPEVTAHFCLNPSDNENIFVSGDGCVAQPSGEEAIDQTLHVLPTKSSLENHRKETNSLHSNTDLNVEWESIETLQCNGAVAEVRHTITDNDRLKLDTPSEAINKYICDKNTCDSRSDADMTDNESSDSVRIISLEEFSDSDYSPLPSQSEETNCCSDNKQLPAVCEGKSVEAREKKKEGKRTISLSQYKERQKHRRSQFSSWPPSPLSDLGGSNSRQSLGKSLSHSLPVLGQDELSTSQGSSSVLPLSEASEQEHSVAESGTPGIFKVGGSDIETLQSTSENLDTRGETGTCQRFMGKHSELWERLQARSSALKSPEPRVHRTESVPASPVHRMSVELKRSASFHGHRYPASKRLKMEAAVTQR